METVPPEVVIARSTLTSGLVALFVESLLFGAFTVLYGICAWLLVIPDARRARGRSQRDLSLFAASTLMFVLALVHVALDVHIALESFITNAGNIMRMSDSLDLYNGLPNTIGAVKFGIYVTQVLIGDGFMIYRAYIVWDRRKRVTVFPLLLLATETVLGYYISFSGPSSMKFRQGASYVDAFVNAFFLLSVATNLISTGLIMTPILRSDWEVEGHGLPGNSHLRSVRWRVFESILQSAAIYSITSTSLAVTSFVSPTIAFPACHSVFPSVIGIVFLLIVARICSNVNAKAVSADLPRLSMLPVNRDGTTVSNTMLIPVDAVQDASEPLSPCSMRSLPIAIHVSVSTTSDSESVSSFDRDSQSSITKMLAALSPDNEESERPMSPKITMHAFERDERV